MNELIQNADIVLLPLLAGLMVLLTHVLLGQEVLKRGIIFLDIAIAQIAAMGVMISMLIGLEQQDTLTQVISVACALSGAILLHFTEQYFRPRQEAIIGVTFILAASASLLLLSGNPHGGDQISEIMSGQILWVGSTQLIQLALMTAFVSVLLWLRKQYNLNWLFYPAFAVAITSSVQVIGVYLVFATLIIPAMTVNATSIKTVILAFLIGLFSYTIGLLISMITDLPTGPLIVWVMAMSSVTYFLVMQLRKYQNNAQQSIK
jgi:zinc/manganese transport system permease protein